MNQAQEIDILKRKLLKAKEKFAQFGGKQGLESLSGSQVSLFDEDRSISTSN